jgi:hypothetical protein
VCQQEVAIQKARVEERLPFPEAWKRQFEQQPKPMMVTYAQAAAYRPLTSEMSTQIESAPPVPENGVLKKPLQTQHATKRAGVPKNHMLMSLENSPTQTEPFLSTP